MDRSQVPESGVPLVRGVLAIVAVGIGLGLAFNALALRGSGGLAWVRTERPLASLSATDRTSPGATPGAADGERERSESGAATDLGEDASAAAGAGASGDSPGTESLAGSPSPGRRGASESSAAPAGRPTAGPPSASSPARPGRTATPGPATPESAARPGSPPPRTSAPAVSADPPELAVAIPDRRDPIEADLVMTKRLFDAGALFLDARSREEYAEGHIPGATAMPFDEVFRDPARLKEIDSAGKPIVTYCDGADCDLSRNLGFALTDAGFRKVLVFTGGLPQWRQAGYPLVVGAAGARP